MKCPFCNQDNQGSLIPDLYRIITLSDEEDSVMSAEGVLLLMRG